MSDTPRGREGTPYATKPCLPSRSRPVLGASCRGPRWFVPLVPQERDRCSIVRVTTLLVLARLEALGALSQPYGVVGLRASVSEEVVTRGKEKGIPDVAVVEVALRLYTEGKVRKSRAAEIAGLSL